MARKPRIHYHGAAYHVILRGNGGQDIFYSKADRSRFYFLLQEGVEKYGHRIHGHCLMTNHVHLVIQVSEVPLSRIMHNIGFRYTNYLNRRLQRKGHIFQGRYKALLVDADSYLLELIRYIHCNPVRARLVQSPEHYPWSSHRTYLGRDDVGWLTTDLVLSQFAGRQQRARSGYADFIAQGVDEKHRVEFHQGSYQGRILGDDRFGEKTLARTAEPLPRPLHLEQIVKAVCDGYGINADLLREPGKQQPGAKARAVAAYLVQNADNITLSELAHYVRRDLASLSRAAGRLPHRLPSDAGLARRLAAIQQHLEQMSKCQA